MMDNDEFKKQLLIVIPIYNPDEKLIQLFKMIELQRKSVKILLIDSGVDKEYRCHISAKLDVDIREISPEEFNHGGTRQWGIELYPDVDIYVFLTQDAILSNEFSIDNLISLFADNEIGAAYGRQFPHKNANVFAKTAREINYSTKSHIYTLVDKEKHGIKTCFLSNSFAAYRRTAIEEIGGFPTNTILSEDMYVAAKMLMNGWKIGYAADACVYHSHNYTIAQEFKRYFDIGVFHSREKWIRDTFGAAEGEGKKYVIYEIKKILQTSSWLLITMLFRDISKFCGYRLGLLERILPRRLKKIISMNARFWDCN